MPQRSNDRGATTVLVAGSLLVLMGFAALAIDWGSGVLQVRQDQNSVDFGVLAAVIEADLDAPAPGSTCDGYAAETLAACNGSVEAIRIVEANLGFTPDWTQVPCDPNRPAEFSLVSPLTDCISFTDELSMARVITPTISAEVYFSPVFGVGDLDTNAAAEAGASFGLGGLVLPFGIPGDAASQDHECLRAGSHPSWGVCDGPTTGNFGSLDVSVYGVPTADTTERCGNADTNGRLTWNIIKGIDHPWTVYTGGPIVNDRTACPVFNAGANQIWGQTGQGSALDAGFLGSSNAYSASGTTLPGRVVRGTNTVRVRNAGSGNPAADVDDTPLWDFLTTDLVGDDPCHDLQVDLSVPADGDFIDPEDINIIGNVSDHDEMDDCLKAWRLAEIPQTVIFEVALGSAVRYGFAPELTSSTFSNGNATYEIASFLPVYIETMWFGCTGSGRCRIVHTPGMPDLGNCNPINDPESITCGIPGNGNQGLDAVSSFFLRPGMLPDSIKEPFPGSDTQTSVNLTR